MAYNNGFPLGYQPYNPWLMQQPQGMQVAQNNNPAIIWVANLNEALNYPVAPNAAVALWDSNSPSVYIKKADASGKPTMTIYDLVERKNEPQTASAQKTDYVTHDELKGVEGRLDGFRDEIERIAKQIKDMTAKEAKK